MGIDLRGHLLAMPGDNCPLFSPSCGLVSSQFLFKVLLGSEANEEF